MMITLTSYKSLFPQLIMAFKLSLFEINILSLSFRNCLEVTSEFGFEQLIRVSDWGMGMCWAIFFLRNLPFILCLDELLRWLHLRPNGLSQLCLGGSASFTHCEYETSPYLLNAFFPTALLRNN